MPLRPVKDKPHWPHVPLSNGAGRVKFRLAAFEARAAALDAQILLRRGVGEGLGQVPT